jgi:hypothetical protein
MTQLDTKQNKIKEQMHIILEKFWDRQFDRNTAVDQLYSLYQEGQRDLEKKSVEELKPIMGEAYTDLSVQVAFKEGYNKAIELLSTLKKGKE